MSKQPECSTCGLSIPNKVCPECRPLKKASVGHNDEAAEVGAGEEEEKEKDSKAIWAFFIGAAIVGVGAVLYVKARKQNYLPISNPRSPGQIACLPEAKLPGEWYG